MKRPTAVLFFTLLIVMVGFGIIIPIMPFYVTSFGASALTVGLLMSSFSLAQLIFAPIWGKLSDRIGRKPVIMIGIAGSVLSFLVMAFANGVGMLFVARILGGILSSATLPTAQAYVADSTSLQDRGQGMGLMGAAMGLGMVFGPAIGGTLSAFGLSAPFLFGAALALLNLVSVAFFLREPERRAVARPAAHRSSPVGSLIGAIAAPLSFYFIMTFLVSFAMANLQSTFALFSQAHLGLSATDMGLIFAAMGITSAPVQGAFVGRAIERFGEDRLIQAGLIITAAGFLLILVSFDLASLTLFAVVQNLGSSIVRPSLSSLISKRTEEDRQGSVMGTQASFDSLGRIVGPAWGGFVFEADAAYPYLTGAAIFMAAFAAALLRSSRAAAPGPVTGTPPGS